MRTGRPPIEPGVLKKAVLTIKLSKEEQKKIRLAAGAKKPSTWAREILIENSK